jgi:hypothetical protein
MRKVRLIHFVTIFFIIAQTNSIVKASSFIEIQIGEYIIFQIPKSWEVLSDNRIIKLNSFLESILSVPKTVNFQANLKNNNGKAITTVQIYQWESNFDQTDIIEMQKNEIGNYDKVMKEQMMKELVKVGGSISDWHGTKKQKINDLTVLSSEYSRTSEPSLSGHFRVQVLRVFSGSISFSFVISYHENSSTPMRIIVDKIISTLRCPRCYSYVDNCTEFLKYSEQDRSSAVLEVLTNATPVQKLTIEIMLEEACKGNVPDFSRSEANKDVGKLLPYLRQKK